MSVINGVASNEASSKYQTSCPYIGMLSDPQTHVGVADVRNYCHLLTPPGEIRISHQQGFCLSQNFPICEIYKTSGEGDIPEGIIESPGASKRGFALPLLFARRSKPKKQPIAEPSVQPVQEVLEDNTIAPVLATAAAESASEAVLPGGVATGFEATQLNTIAPAVEEDEFSTKYSAEPVDYHEQADSSRNRKGIWLLLVAVALIVLTVSAWAVYDRVQNVRREAAIAAEINYTKSLATAVQDMSAAANAWATAASVLEAQQATATAVIFATQTAAQADRLAMQVVNSTATAAATVTPSLPVVCQNINDASLTIVSGPELNPKLRTIYRSGLSKPQASWVIQNTGNCSWSQVLLWSVLDNTITQPIIKQNGLVLTPTSSENPTLISPGEQIELILEFPAAQAQRVGGEWVLIVDGLSMIGQPRVILKADNWVIFSAVVQPTATPRRVRPPSDTPAPGVEPTPENPPPTQPAPPTPPTPPTR